MSDLPRRAQAMRRGMEQSELGSLVIFGHENIRYLCGFSGSAGVLVVTQEELLLLSDSRYRLQAAEETTGVRFVEVEGRVVDSLSNVLAGTQGRVGVESSHLPVAEWRRLEPALGEWEYTFVDGAVERIRMVKDSR